MPSYSKRVEVKGKSSQQLYDVVSVEIERLMAKFSVGNVEVQREPGQKQVQVKSSMFSGVLVCEEGAIRLDAKLSLFAAPFRSKIDEGIDRWVAKTFGSPSTHV